MPMFMKKPVVKIDTLRLTVAGITLGFPLEPRRPSVNRAAQQPAPPQRRMRETPDFDAFPNASRFDGVSDKLDMPYAPELNPASFTVEMWAMVQGGTGYQSVLSSVAGSPLEGRKGYLFCLTPSRQWQFWTGSGEPKAFWRVLRGPVAVPDVWTHLAGTYDRQSRTVTFYVSGQEVGRQSGVHYQPNDRNPTRVGAGATEQWGASPCFFCGKVAEVHIWDRVLGPVEIQALASGQSIDVQAEPVAEMGSEGQDGESGTGSTTAQRSPAPETPPPDMFGQGASAWPAVSPLAWGGGDRSPLSRSPVAEQPLAWLEQATASSVPDPQSALWQIGSPGQAGVPAPTGAWVPVHNYTIGTDPDPVNRPTIPSCLVPATASTIPNSTSQLNIHFVLAEDYTEGQLVLCYDRYGSGEDSIFLDGERIASTPGADRGKLKQSQIPLGFAAKGPHTISITTSNSGDSAHVIDYLQLKTVKPMLSNLTSQVLPSGNQSQSGSGSEGGQNARSQGGQDAGGMLGGLLSPATGLLGQATGALGGATGALGQVAGAAGGAGQLLGQATGMLGGLTGQGGGQGGAGGLLGSLPGVGGLLGGGGQGGGGGGLLGGLPLVGGVLDQVGGIAGGLPGVGGLLGQLGGIAGGLPGVGGALGGLPGVGGILGQGGGAGGMGGQVMPGTQSAQVVLQLAQLVAQINALLAQVTQLLNVLAGAGQVAGGGIPGLGGGIPGLGGGIPGLGHLSAQQVAQLQQLAQLQQQYGLTPQQVAQLQAQILHGGQR